MKSRRFSAPWRADRSQAAMSSATEGQGAADRLQHRAAAGAAWEG
jgi:hypothetical protein